MEQHEKTESEDLTFQEAKRKIIEKVGEANYYAFYEDDLIDEYIIGNEDDNDGQEFVADFNSFKE